MEGGWGRKVTRFSNGFKLSNCKTLRLPKVDASLTPPVVPHVKVEWHEFNSSFLCLNCGGFRKLGHLIFRGLWRCKDGPFSRGDTDLTWLDWGGVRHGRSVKPFVTEGCYGCTSDVELLLVLCACVGLSSCGRTLRLREVSTVVVLGSEGQRRSEGALGSTSTTLSLPYRSFVVSICSWHKHLSVMRKDHKKLYEVFVIFVSILSGVRK